jgi:hypothetical protein
MWAFPHTIKTKSSETKGITLILSYATTLRNATTAYADAYLHSILSCKTDNYSFWHITDGY